LLLLLAFALLPLGDRCQLAAAARRDKLVVFDLDAGERVDREFGEPT